jgi:hypothetical protein
MLLNVLGKRRGRRAPLGNQGPVLFIKKVFMLPAALTSITRAARKEGSSSFSVGRSSLSVGEVKAKSLGSLGKFVTDRGVRSSCSSSHTSIDDISCSLASRSPPGTPYDRRSERQAERRHFLRARSSQKAGLHSRETLETRVWAVFSGFPRRRFFFGSALVTHAWLSCVRKKSPLCGGVGRTRAAL